MSEPDETGYCRHCGRDVDLVKSAHRGAVLGKHFRNRIAEGAPWNGDDYDQDAEQSRCKGTFRSPTSRPPEDPRHAFQNEGNFEEGESISNPRSGLYIDRSGESGRLQYRDIEGAEHDPVFGYRKPAAAPTVRSDGELRRMSVLQEALERVGQHDTARALEEEEARSQRRREMIERDELLHPRASHYQWAPGAQTAGSWLSGLANDPSFQRDALHAPLAPGAMTAGQCSELASRLQAVGYTGTPEELQALWDAYAQNAVPQSSGVDIDIDATVEAFTRHRRVPPETARRLNDMFTRVGPPQPAIRDEITTANLAAAMGAPLQSWQRRLLETVNIAPDSDSEVEPPEPDEGSTMSPETVQQRFRGPSEVLVIVDEVQRVSVNGEEVPGISDVTINAIASEGMPAYQCTVVDETFTFNWEDFQRAVDIVRTPTISERFFMNSTVRGLPRPDPVIRDANGVHIGTRLPGIVIDEPFFSVPEIRALLDRCGITKYNINEVKATRFGDDVHWMQHINIEWSADPETQPIPTERIGGWRVAVEGQYGGECDISSVVTRFTEYQDSAMQRHVRFE